MANATAVCTSFKVELLKGIHNFGTGVVRSTTTADTINAALYYTTANIGASKATYGGDYRVTSDTGEVVGTGYPIGGTTVETTQPLSSGTTAYWTPSTAALGPLFAIFTNITITSAFDACLLYNANQGNRAILIFTFGAQTITAGTMSISMPTNDASSALLRLV